MADLPSASQPVSARRTGRRPSYLTAAEILDAIKAWHALYGEPPTMADWDPYRARVLGQRWRIARYDAGDWPSAKTVRNHFGRLSHAVAMAGLVPRKQGQRRAYQQAALTEEVLLHLAQVKALDDRTPTPVALAAAIREVARAADSTSRADLRAALIELAATALRWADHPSPHAPRRGAALDAV